MARSLRFLGSPATGQDQQWRPWSRLRKNRSDCVKRTIRGDDNAIAEAQLRARNLKKRGISHAFATTTGNARKGPWRLGRVK